MMSGSPPTERKARTGLLTPPTKTCSARSKISFERRRSGLLRVGVASMVRGVKLSRLSGFEPAGDVLGVIGEDDFCAGALDASEEFEDDALFVEPAFLGGGFDHGVFAADVVGADGDVEGI